MAYEDLLNRGMIKPFAAGTAQSASRLALAKRDINANETPMSYLKYRSPKDVFQQLLLQEGEPSGHGQRANNVIYLNMFRPTGPKG
jgi:hypothetical protein